MKSIRRVVLVQPNDILRAMNDADVKIVGRNLTKIRESKKVSMEMLAEKMRAADYKWTKATVYAIEHGDRQLKLTEAADVIRCLGGDPVKDMGQLLISPDEWDIKEAIESMAMASRRSLDFFRLCVIKYNLLVDGFNKELNISIHRRYNGYTEDTFNRLIDAIQNSNPDKTLSALVEYAAKNLKTSLVAGDGFSLPETLLMIETYKGKPEHKVKDGEAL